MRGVSTILSFMALLIFPLLTQSASAQPRPADTTSTTPVKTVKPHAVIPQSALIQPAALTKLLHTAKQPLILQVGFHMMYEEAHIPGAVYAGPARTAAGLENLRAQVSRVKKDRPIVIYCGCCPWEHCPNIRPAYKALEALGFTHVKALYLANNFGDNWVHKGYPVEGTIK